MSHYSSEEESSNKELIYNICAGSNMEIETSGESIDMLMEKELCICIIQCPYYMKIYKWTYYHVIDEIYNEVDDVEPWMADGAKEPSHAFCLLYKLFTMKLTVKQIEGLLKHRDSPYITAIGFLYLRYVAHPKTLWTWYEPYLKDSREFSPGSNCCLITMGVYVRDLILGQCYFGSILPRVPNRVIRQVTANLEKMRLPTNLSGFTGVSSFHGSQDTSSWSPPVSVYFEQRAPHRASTSHRNRSRSRSRSCCSNRGKDYDWDIRYDHHHGRGSRSKHAEVRRGNKREHGKNRNRGSSSPNRSRSRSHSSSDHQDIDRSRCDRDRDRGSQGRQHGKSRQRGSSSRQRSRSRSKSSSCDRDIDRSRRDRERDRGSRDEYRRSQRRSRRGTRRKHRAEAVAGAKEKADGAGSGWEA